MKRMALLLVIMVCLPFTMRGGVSNRGDSIVEELKAMPHDSLVLRKAYITAQKYIDELWMLDILDFGVKESRRQKHVLWELAFMGSKVRWAHNKHDWDKMQQFLDEQYKVAVERNQYGNYVSQLAQSVIVLNGVGQYERAQLYIDRLEKELREAGQDVYDYLEIYIYFAKADYYSSRGERDKSRDIYLKALYNGVKNNSVATHIVVQLPY